MSQQTVFSFLHMLIPSNPVISTGSWTNSVIIKQYLKYMSFSPRLTTRFPKHLGIWFTYCVQISSKKKVSRKMYLLLHCIVYHPLFPWSVCVSDLCNLFIQALNDSLKWGLKNWDIINTLKEFSVSTSHPLSYLPSASPLTTTKI